MKKFFASLTTALRKKDNLLIIMAVSVAVVVMLSVTVAFLLKPAKYDGETAPVPGGVIPAEQTLRHPLTGEQLQTPLALWPQVFGVMIENSADAWPLTGLDEAFLIIEAPVEGNIPRFIAFYSEEAEADKVGPVRSARPYYLDWASEFGAVYAHVGGSPEALEKLKTLPIYDLNEFFQGEYFWRDNRRYAPHNAYTSLAELTQSLLELEPEEASYEAWKFKPSNQSKCVIGETCLNAELAWGGGSTYNVSLLYEMETNKYLRAESESSIGPKIWANNVVVMATDISVIDNVGRRALRTLGEGDALIFQDGTMILGKWKKPTVTERLRFYDDADQEILFNVGNTVIEVVPALSAVTTSLSQ